MDAVYFTAGDLDALRAARAARVLVANPRALDALGHGVSLDALVLSRTTPSSAMTRSGSEGEAELVVLTEGARGGTIACAPERPGSWAAVRRRASPSTPTAAATRSRPGSLTGSAPA